MSDASPARFERTPRTTVARKRERARYDRALVHSIIDEALIASVALSIDGRAELRPMLHARVGADLILHGLAANPFLAALASGAQACINVTIADALVLARRIEDHTMFYRSATIYGSGIDVSDAAEKEKLMQAVFTKLVQTDRFTRLPPLDRAYLAATRVVRVPLIECVAKVNDQFPLSNEPTANVWSGKIPLTLARGEPVADERTVVEGLPFVV